jgi:tRNA wybutosine-synthesizing protein 3
MSDRHFDERKARLVAEIESPAPDASPKGTIDARIMPLISLLNSHADVVTTSSCSGRVSVFLEGGDAASRVSGKGEGGRWLYVSHDPLDIAGRSDSELADMMVGTVGSWNGSLVPTAGSRFVHFKFETMVSFRNTPSCSASESSP